MNFEKITEDQFIRAELHIKYDYEDIKLPKRATKGSAGYDIYALSDITFLPGDTHLIPTGIKVRLDVDKVLITPRSGLGFKYKTHLWNTIGVIDSDYINSDNEGHIWVKMMNESDKEFTVKKGEAFCQGIILQYFKTEDDEVTDVRNGGFGSTTK